jgi:hypothetical protein
VGAALLVSAGLVLETEGLVGPLDDRLPRLAAGALIALPLGCWLIAITLQRRDAGRTFQQQAAANRLASRVLMVTLVGLLAAVGAIIGGSVFFEAEVGLVGAGLAAVVGLFGLLLAQQDGVGVVLSSAGAQPIGDRRLQDVAAEMALAAGISRPGLYVVVHPSLNAFAVGFDPDDAAIVVTRGLLDGLDREQLQGVVAHEVAHIRTPLDRRPHRAAPAASWRRRGPRGPR